MKKYILGLLSIVTFFFSSCSNDDIEIAHKITFKVKPSSVIASFHPIFPEDFELDTTVLKLRTSIFIYNEAGDLASSATAYVNGYEKDVIFNILLPSGKYIAVATTNVVEKSKEEVTFEFWCYKDVKKLTTFKIENVVNGPGYDWEILGVSSVKVEVDGKKEIAIPVQPAGALIVPIFQGIHADKSVVFMELAFSRFADKIYFDNDGKWSVNFIRDGDFGYSKEKIDLTKSVYDKSTNLYSYVFHLPDSKYECRFNYKKDNNNWYFLDPLKINLKAGQQYRVTFDLLTKTSSVTLTNSASASLLNNQTDFSKGKQVLQVESITELSSRGNKSKIE